MQPKPRDLAADESVNTKTGPTEKAIKISLDGLYLCRRRPTLPHTYACSTIGPAGLNFRVRDRNGCFPCGKITGFVDVWPTAGHSVPGVGYTQNLITSILKEPSQRLL